ncbi:hypothetical protein B0H67DRAFT_554776 [Lasiosphaeris hirsuta]|uniref:Transmembrane protein n=1 Tax=Lasiosphaeris hirsuta TaxID=260670 RepID=A0AA40A7E2_9PEZI|nr:hypothetical protein B0H67DRAFT_554776 [Lasiosphaeris hirsuta]
MATTERSSQTTFRNWLDGYYNAIIGTAALGGQITFTVIVTDILDPRTLRSRDPAVNPADVFSVETIRLLIALSWLLFVATLGLAITAKLVCCSPPFPGADDLKLPPNGPTHAILILALNALSIGAFFLLSLAITAYVPVAGWMGVAMLSIYSLGVLGLWLVMNTGFRNSVVAPMVGPFRPEWSPPRGDNIASIRVEERSTDQAVQQVGSSLRRTV